MQQAHWWPLAGQESHPQGQCQPTGTPGRAKASAHGHPGKGQGLSPAAPSAFPGALPTLLPPCPGPRLRAQPPVHLLQDLCNAAQRLPQVVPQVVLQQGQAGIPQGGAHHVDNTCVPQADRTLQQHIQSLHDVQLGLWSRQQMVLKGVQGMAWSSWC